MTIYEPLREGFREFNRLLLDSQQWDAKHQAAAAQQERENTRLQSQLELQQFNKEMAMHNLELSKRGEQRAVTRLRADLENAEKNYLLADKQFKETQKQNKIRNDRNSVIDVMNFENQQHAQQIAENTDARAEVAAAERTAMHKQNLEKTKNELVKVRDEARKIRDRSTPRQVDLSALAGNDLLENGKQELISYLNQNNPKIADIQNNIPVDKNGNPVLISANDLTKIYPGLATLAAKYDDRNRVVQKNIEALRGKHKELKSFVASTKNKHKGKHMKDVAIANREIKVLEKQIKQHEAFFTPQGQLNYHQEEADEAQNRATMLLDMGQTNQAAVAEKQAAHHRENVEIITKQMTKPDAISADGLRQIKTYVKGTNEPGPLVTRDLTTGDLILTMNGQTIRTKSSLADLGLTHSAPAKESPEKDLTPGQMTNFNEDIKATGMAAKIVDQIGTPIKQNLGKLATLYSQTKFKGNPKQNLLSKQAALEFYRKTHLSWKDDVDNIPYILSNKQVTAKALTKVAERYSDDLAIAQASAQEAKDNGNNKDTVGWTKRAEMLSRRLKNLQSLSKGFSKRDRIKAALEKFASYEFEQQWREESGDEFMKPYTPDRRNSKFVTGGM